MIEKNIPIHIFLSFAKKVVYEKSIDIIISSIVPSLM